MAYFPRNLNHNAISLHSVSVDMPWKTQWKIPTAITQAVLKAFLNHEHVQSTMHYAPGCKDPLGKKRHVSLTSAIKMKT